MKKAKLVLITGACLWCCGATAQESQKVAIFDPAGDVSASYKEIVREEISNIIVNTGKFTVLERQLINKVLEENKFQMGGLVDDSQVGEIGKRMGANYVFVTSLTAMGKEFYLSFKLIDVQTARIEKQKTGRTTKAGDDLIDVTQGVVGEMFGALVAVAPAKKVQAAPTEAPRPSGALVADGRSVILNGRELKQNEVRLLFTNSNALQLYNKGMSQNSWGNGLLIAAAVLAVGGLSISGTMEWEDDGAGVGMGLITGGAAAIGGIILKVISKSSVEKAVDGYNRSQYTSQATLKFGQTRHGLGLVYTF
ncbi:MAG: CsgG/HfaB family protein [Prevotellaceae bacterium]|jgi:hypothetical protein|nr:CsgG/HfaB family protein [Prevotellaceae bacterium]